MKQTKIRTSSLSLTLEPGNKILVRWNIFYYYYQRKQDLELKTKDAWAGFNNNLDFDDCSHEHPELSVPGN